MIDEKNLVVLEQNLQRIFGLKIGRTTFREVQNAILAAAQGNKDVANTLFETLLSGEVKDKSLGTHAQNHVISMINTYSVPFRLARDVYERGDFLQLITSDTIQQNDKPLFVNRIKRVDGKEHQFICDVPSTIHLLTHFLSRLQELEVSNPKARALEPFAKDLAALKQRLDQLSVSHKDK